MIAIVYPEFYGIGGIARYLDSFLTNLPKNHGGVVLITGDEYQFERRYDGVEIIHIPITNNRLSLFSWSIQAWRLVKKMHREGKISVVNFHFPPLIPGLFIPKNIPVVLTAHTTYLGMSGKYYSEKLYTGQWGAVSLWIKFWMERVTFRKISKVITLSEQGKEEVLRYNFSGPMDIIPNGVDISSFAPDHSIKKDIDVLFAGRIERRKGSRPMVEVCKELIRARPDIKILIVGFGTDDSYVNAELARFSDNIELAGKVPFTAMTAFYNRSKVYASTSYYEGLPGTCLEAMAMGLPVVVWDFLFYRGLVIEGRTGWLVAPNKMEQMSERILLAVDDIDGAHNMGEASRELLLGSFNWTLLAKQVLDSIRQWK